MAQYKLIADISSNNGSVNMATMAKKVNGIIIRAGYRGYSAGTIQQDSRWAENSKAAMAAGIPMGVYWFTTATSDAEARAEANKLLQIIKGLNLACPVWLDLEYAPGKKGRADKLTAAKRTQYAVTWLEKVRGAGYQVGVYCNPDFLKSGLVGSKLADYPKWIARYGSSLPMDCEMWQYTSTASGKAYGCQSAGVDLSRCYADWFTTAAPQPAAAPVNMAALEEGATGTQVKALQMLCGMTGKEVDGIFGPKTRKAVDKKRVALGLSATGVADAEFWVKVLK